MFTIDALTGRTRSLKRAAVVLGALAAFLPSVARAHFRLDAPASWMSQDASGSPQKLGPCGDESGGTPTGTVTQFQSGQTITLKWTEIVAHDGWYRIALSYQGGTDLADPLVVIAANGDSADAGIEATPITPVLADGLFPHAAAGAAGRHYTYSVKLPDRACTKCTLQVTQYMNGHPSNLPNLADGAINPDGYFYHHCAMIAIAPSDAGVAVSDAGQDTGTVSEDAGDSRAPTSTTDSSAPMDVIEATTPSGGDTDGASTGSSSGSGNSGQTGGPAAPGDAMGSSASSTGANSQGHGGVSVDGSMTSGGSLGTGAGQDAESGASSSVSADGGGCLVGGVGRGASPPGLALLGALLALRVARKRSAARAGRGAPFLPTHGRGAAMETPGLCADCRESRRVKASRGTVFYMCKRHERDPAFPKYPRLPVVVCRGHAPRTERGEPEESD